MTRRASCELLPGHAWYDIHTNVFPFGIRELLGRIQAPNRKTADATAAAQFTGAITVTLSIKPKRRRRQYARDLGDTKGTP